MPESTHPPQLPSEGFVRLPIILYLLTIGKTKWWKGVKEGRFPAPIKLGSRTTVWRVEDIRALLNQGPALSAPTPRSQGGAA